MRDRLFQTGKELKDALNKDIADFKKMKKEGYDTSGVESVIKHKMKMLREKSW